MGQCEAALDNQRRCPNDAENHIQFTAEILGKNVTINREVCGDHSPSGDEANVTPLAEGEKQ